MQKQDFGQLNLMPRCTFLGRAMTALTGVSQQVRTASECMLQGVVRGGLCVASLCE